MQKTKFLELLKSSTLFSEQEKKTITHASGQFPEEKMEQLVGLLEEERKIQYEVEGVKKKWRAYVETFFEQKLPAARTLSKAIKKISKF